jgi:histidyl-tRNA synthetase
LGEAAEAVALALLQDLRRAGLRAEMAYRGNMKRRMERANKIGAHTAIILGEDEIAQGVATIKNLNDGTQTQLALAGIAAALANR